MKEQWEMFKQRWMLWEKSLYPVLDNITSWIIEWKVYSIAGFSNTWKSKLSYSYAQDFVKQGKKVLYFSLEVDKWFLLTDILSAYYSIPKSEVFNKSINPNNFRNLKIYDDVLDLESIKQISRKENPDIIFIDFAQNVQCEWTSEYEKMTAYALGIQQFAIETWITIFSLSQVSNTSRNSDDSSATLKGSWALFASSDVIFLLYRESGDLKFSIMKNKYWWLKKFDVDVDYARCKFILNEEFPESRAAWV